jgi:hypothetical protein
MTARSTAVRTLAPAVLLAGAFCDGGVNLVVATEG